MIDRFTPPRAASSLPPRSETMSEMTVPRRESLRKVRFGTSDMMVTEVCGGTMTWGSFNDKEDDAHDQLDKLWYVLAFPKFNDCSARLRVTVCSHTCLVVSRPILTRKTLVLDFRHQLYQVYC
jgi:hypothetical protein